MSDSNSKTWKVIAIDNYDRQHISDQLIADNMTETEANVKASAMNAKTSDDYWWYYKAVPQDYKLYTFDPNA